MSGGSRINGGPPPDPNSSRSERRGFKLRKLPSAGYQGTIPAFPLPDPTPRELDVWAQVWRTPQAVAWSIEQWRIPAVGLYVRTRVRCEDPAVSGAVLAHVHRFGDDVGLTTGGMARLGWTVVEPPEEEPAARPPSTSAKPVRRMRG